MSSENDAAAEDRLKKWIDSGEPDEWIATHWFRAADQKFEDFIKKLHDGRYWPMPETRIRSYLWKRAARYVRLSLSDTDKHNNNRRRMTSVIWYVLGISIVGLACGFFTGGSSTPVVSTILPLLFALVAGSSGLYIATANLNEPFASWRMLWLGRLFVVFGFACLLGAFGGIYARLATTQPAQADDLLRFGKGSTRDQVELAALRSKLRILGLTRNEQAAVLQIAAQELAEAASPMPSTQVQVLVAQGEALLKALRTSQKLSEQHGSPVPEEINNLVTSLEDFSNRARPWLKLGMPRGLYAISLDSLFFRLSQISMATKIEVINWISQNRVDRDPLDAMFQTIHSDFARRDILDWRMGQSVGDRLDKYIQISPKASKPADDREELLPSIEDESTASEEVERGK